MKNKSILIRTFLFVLCISFYENSILSQTCQPLENQRLSTTNAVNFNSVSSAITDNYGPGLNNSLNGRWNPIASAAQLGYRLFNDEEFAAGFNSVGVYDNGATGHVTVNRVGDPSAPNRSGYKLTVAWDGIGTPNPGVGGFLQTYPTATNKIIVQKFRAKIPVGFYILQAENPIGNDANDYFVTNNYGTGKYEDYIRVSHCGSTGSFSTAGHVFVVGSGAWSIDIASCSAYEIESSNLVRTGDNVAFGTGNFNGNVVLGTPNNSNQIRHIYTYSTNNADSRSWMVGPDFNAYGDFGIYKSGSQNNSSWNALMYFTPNGGINFSGPIANAGNQAYLGPISSPSAAFTNSIAIGAPTHLPSNYALAVNGNAYFTKATIMLNANWPDYIFNKDYKLPKLSDVESFIKTNHHLPELPSAKEVEKEGIDIAKNQALLLKKIEELTLIIINQDKKIENLSKKFQKNGKRKFNQVDK